MTSRVRVKDLQDQAQVGNVVKPQPVLYCPFCGAEYSADRRDYWDVADEHEFMCCNEPLLLVRMHTVYEEVNKP